MASANDRTAAKQSKKGFLSPFFKPVFILLHIAGYIAVALVVGILVEWVGITFWWPTDHASQMLITELQYLGNNFSTSVAGMSPADLAATVAIKIQGLLTENVFIRFMRETASHPQHSFFLRSIATFVSLVAVYSESALFVTMTLAARLTIVMLSILIIALVAIITAIDGLVERELREYGGDREHSRIVHLAMEWSPRLAFIAPIAYLAWPTVANPAYFFIPAMTLYGITNYIFFSKYQKRL